ncbi:MAG TPA: hypothetical protein VNL16_01450 [Chloroflexota bacterium]|nr:hypothetical protein [Chloroflexota bacterium]
MHLVAFVLTLSLILSACTTARVSPATPTRLAPLPAPTDTLAAPSQGPLEPTAVVATPITVLPTASPLPSAPATPLPTATPTIEARSLSPAVQSAAAAFRALLPETSPLTAAQIQKAQGALASAATTFVSSGESSSAKLRAQFAASLKPNGQESATVLSADLDGDSKPELLVGVSEPGLDPLIFPGSQSVWNLLLPTPGTAAPLDLTTNVVQVQDFAGDGRPDVVLTRTAEGASAATTEIVIVAWDGTQARALFDQTISDWGGPASWKIQPDGGVALTCAAFGTYDHNLLPHPDQTRVYRWDGATFGLVSRQTTPPKTRRQMMNLAEADFFAGDLDTAATRYRSVIGDSSLTVDPGDQVDWPNFARLRLGQIAALSGQSATAATWLTAAAKAGPPLGAEASAFLHGERTGGPSAGFAAIQRSDLPTQFDQSRMGNLDFPVTLGAFGAIGEGVSADLNDLGDAGRLSATELSSKLTQVGFQTRDTTIADLDGNGSAEIAMILPFGSREQTLWLFVHSTTGWQAIATVPATDGLGGVQTLANHQQAIRVIGPTGSDPRVTFLTWNGRQVGSAAKPAAIPVPIQTDFPVAGSSCRVAEDFAVQPAAIRAGHATAWEYGIPTKFSLSLHVSLT